MASLFLGNFHAKPYTGTAMQVKRKLCGLPFGQLEVNKDMHFSILTNNHRKNMKFIFEKMENSYDSILIATAFFSETEMIIKMIDKNINIVLLVSL